MNFDSQNIVHVYYHGAGIQSTLKENNQFIDRLIGLGGAVAGARPKVLLQVEERNWLIKFRSSSDSHDISAIEYAYHLMAN